MSGVSRLSVREIAIPFLGMLNVFGFDHINGKHHEFKRYNVDEDLSAIEFSENSIGYYNQRLKEEGLCVILLTDLLKRNNFKQALKVIRENYGFSSSRLGVIYEFSSDELEDEEIEDWEKYEMINLIIKVIEAKIDEKEKATT